MKLTLNLASRPYVNRSLLYATYIGLLVVLVLLSLLNLFNFLRSREESARLQQHIGELQRRTAPVAAVGDYSAAAHQQLNRRIQYANGVLERDSRRRSELFDQLEQLLVDGVRLSSLSPDFKTQVLRLSGNADEVETLRRFMDRLVTSPAFTHAYLLQQSARNSADGADGIDFTIELKGRAEP